MNTQPVIVALAKGREDREYSFEALTLESKDSSLLSSKELPPSPHSSQALVPHRTTPSHKPVPRANGTPNFKTVPTTRPAQFKTVPTTKSVPATPNHLQKTAPTSSNGPSTPSKPKPATSTTAPATTTTVSTSVSKMASTRAQTQCLDLCHKTTALGDRISIHVLEYLTSTKQLQPGFETLAHEFLDILQILFAIEAGLADCNRTGQRFPPEMITELDHKFRVTQADFQILDQMLGKFLGTSGRVKRGWGKIFGDTDIKKMSTALGKTRESLKMSSLVFQWSLGSEKVDNEAGIGYTALAAALDRMDHKPTPGLARSSTNVNGNGSHHQQQSQVHQSAVAPTLAPAPALSPIDMMDSHSQATIQPQYQQHQHQQSQLQQHPSPQYEASLGRASSYHVRLPMSPDHPQPLTLDFRHNSGASGLPTPSTMSTEKHFSGTTDGYDRASTVDDAHSLTGITEFDTLIDDIAGMEVGGNKVVRVTADPSTMPRCYPRATAESDTANLKSALISAVRSKNHKLVEQILNRGVSPNTGPHMHSLKEAILAHDTETVRLLLLFGADPNDPDRDGITPLFAAVEKSFLAGATTLLKYGADPNLVAGPDLESPLATAVIANMVGFSHLLLTYNGDVNHVTADGSTLLISAIKKKTPKTFIDLILDYGAEPNAKSREGKTALFESIQQNRADIVTSLLEHGADPNLPGPKHPLWPSTYNSPCLQVLLSHGADHKKCPGIMELAASLNNIESVRILLKAGVDPNIRKDGTYTPLCTAIRDDRPELIQLLLANGADPNVMASEYPTFKCVTHKRVHFLPTLVAAGANLNSPKGILETAVSLNNIEALNWLLDQGVNPNDKNAKGMSPLTTAIREERMDMVDLLLLRGADPHMRGQDWPICMAVRKPVILKRLLTVVSEPQAFKGVVEMAVSANELESVKLLLAAGVSVEDKNGGVFSPLTTALRENRRDIVRYLLTEAGADVNSPGEHLPIVKALRRFHGEDTEMLELLLEHGADPNKIYRGWNAIMQGVENGDPDVLKLISQKAGVDLEVKDELGRTVVEMAASRGWDEAVQILTDGNVRLKR